MIYSNMKVLKTGLKIFNQTIQQKRKRKTLISLKYVRNLNIKKSFKKKEETKLRRLINDS
jgi:hypothetical protein